MKSYLDVEYTGRKGSSFPATLMNYLKTEHNILPYRVADVGTGTGDFLAPWLEGARPAYGTGFDLENHMREAVRDCFREMDLDAGIDTGWKGLFNLVFSKSVAEHRHDTVEFMRQLSDLARPCGWVVVMAPDWVTCSQTFWDDATHVTPISPARLEMAAKMAGLEVKLCTTVKQTTGLFVPGMQRWLGRVYSSMVSQETALWLEKKTGRAWFRWAKQEAVLLIARKMEI